MKIKERNYSHPNGSTRHIEFVKNYDETYDIIRITYVNYRRTWYDGKDVYFSFCPKGCVKSPSTHFHDYYAQ